jgi:hypothetical protein
MEFEDDSGHVAAAVNSLIRRGVALLSGGEVEAPPACHEAKAVHDAMRSDDTRAAALRGPCGLGASPVGSGWRCTNCRPTRTRTGRASEIGLCKGEHSVELCDPLTKRCDPLTSPPISRARGR